MPAEFDRRPVITGIGLSCAAGPNVDQAWQLIQQGNSTTVAATDDDLGGSLNEKWPGRYFMAGRPDGPSASHHLAMQEALQQSNLMPPATNASTSVPRSRSTKLDDVGFVFGASKGRLIPLEWNASENFRTLAADFPIDPWPASSTGNDLRKHLPIAGPASCPVAACASGLVSLIHASRWIEWNECEAVIAGSADNSLTPSIVAAYRRLGVLSNWKGDPAEACRPFDSDRSGFVIGEGTGVLVLETTASATTRGASPLAVIAGYDHRTDPTGLIDSDPNGEVISIVVANTIRNARLSSHEIDAICCHGTGTIANDRAEAIALRAVFRQSLDEIPCFSLKGAIGHTLGASGSVETAICVKAILAQTIPPSRNSDHIDHACPIGPMPTSAQPRPIRHILKLSYGFGGHVAAMILSQP